MQQTYGGAPPAPQPIPPAPVPAPTRQGDGLSRVLSILAVILSVVALVMSFVIPGATGSAGAPGTPGDRGDKGDQGNQGMQGPAGPAGPAGTNGIDGTNGVNGTNGMNGTNCWDLNGNGIGDVATEDLNGDLLVNVLDCRAATLVVSNATAAAGTISTTASAFEDIPAMTVSVVTTQESLFVITFSAEMWLSNPNYLMGRALVDGTPAEPGANGNLFFTRNAGANGATITVTFYMPNVPAGSHTVTIQWYVFSAGDAGFTDNRALVVMAFPV